MLQFIEIEVCEKTYKKMYTLQQSIDTDLTLTFLLQVKVNEMNKLKNEMVRDEVNE